jgi:hypothetical protein
MTPLKHVIPVLVVSCIILLVLASGCANISTKQKVGDVSTTTGTSSGTSSSVAANDKYMKADFTVDCTRIMVHDELDYTDTYTTKVKGVVPFLVERDWNKQGPQTYGTHLSGGEGETILNLNSEWKRTCKKAGCTPCHLIYNGPFGLGASIAHYQNDAPADWKALITGLGTPTYDAVMEGKMNQYTTSLDPSCNTLKDASAGVLYTNTEFCFGLPPKPFTFSDGSTITWTSTDPEVDLHSTAVFHISG